MVAFHDPNATFWDCHPILVFLEMSRTGQAPEAPPRLAQMAPGGRLIGPVGRPHWVQDLVLLIRQDSGKFRRVVVETVAYIPLRGVYGFSD